MSLPSLFIGHGSPMNAIEINHWTDAWAKIGLTIPTPRAILSISAHWFIHSTGVTISTAPKTIHDFGGFPPELYKVLYPAPGDPALARRVQQLLAPTPVVLDDRWGLDHGTWSVLLHIYPHADIPVVQLSIDGTRPASYHYELGRKLAPLRDEGILIVGSGNLVHNLRVYAFGEPDADPYDWALRFDETARDIIAAGADRELVDYEKFGNASLLSIPTPEHYLPLLYVVATRQSGDAIAFPVEGIDGGSVSMRAVQIGSE